MPLTGLHQEFLEAGAQAVETNTFGVSRIVFDEYGIGDRTAEINTAAVANARKAMAGRSGRYVCGSLGPTTKLPLD
ncbi:MAG: homocysteine S-methyltransferase family protein [bacterium]